MEILKGNKKNIIFRVDASKEVGLGHLKRCIALAEFLREESSNILFVCRENIICQEIIESNDFRVESIKAKRSQEDSSLLQKLAKKFQANALVLDLKTPIKEDYIKNLRNKENLIIVLDNHGKGAKLADILIYPYARTEKNIKLNGFEGKIYEGLPYAIIGNEFKKVKRKVKKERNSLLVTFGGRDPKELTLKVINAIEKINDIELSVIIILGPFFSKYNKFKAQVSKAKKKYQILKNPRNLPSVMAKASAAIVAVGMSVYELAYLGIPQITIAHSKEHAKFAEDLESLGICLNLGYFKNISENKIAQSIRKIFTDQNIRKSLSEKSTVLIDGCGVERIGRVILKNC